MNFHTRSILHRYIHLLLPLYFALFFQVELAVGSFPYGKWKTIFDQLNAVVSGPPPTLPEDGSFSPALTDFVSKW